MKKRLTALFAALLLALPFPAAAIGAEDDTAGQEQGTTPESTIASDSQASVEDETESVQESPVVLSPHWEQREGQFILLDGTGEPMSGWVQLDGKWYLLSESGIRQNGWREVDGKWYYLDADGVMVDGWQQIGGKWYLFGGGAMKTGWVYNGGKWYYFAESGVMQTGWLELNGKRYYLTPSGGMKTGAITEGSTVYTLDASGAVVSSKDLSTLSNKALGWGQGTQVDSYNRPVGAVSYQEKYGTLGGQFVGPNEKVIYLTFDEGYENGYTASILDTLKAKGVTATFFITGAYLDSQPGLVQRMIEEGHAVGNHTVSHPNLPQCSISRRADEIGVLHDKVEEKFGYSMYLMRPPEGVFSEQVLAQAQGMGYQTVLWSFAYKDWDPSAQMSTSTALQKTTSALHPGAIYLLHAVSKTNTAILGDFIDTARQKGYTFGILPR